MGEGDLFVVVERDDVGVLTVPGAAPGAEERSQGLAERM